MLRKLFLLSLVFSFLSFGLQAQTVEELKATKAEKQATLDALQAEIDALQTQIETMPGWKFGALGTLGFNANRYTNWFGAASPFSGGLDFGIGATAFANLDREKFFWRNGATLNFQKGQTTSDHRNNPVIPDDGLEDVPTIADNIGINSAYGYKLNDKWAISVLGDYKTTLSNINDPGTLDLGAGINWTPMPDLTVYFHPLNYNFVFSNNALQAYESSLGCKILAQYQKSLPMGIAWSSNFSAFVSYSDVTNFSNWEWINGFGFNVWKGIGVGLTYGLRGDMQQSYNNFIATDGTTDANGVFTPNFSVDEAASNFLNIENADGTTGFENKVQSYILVGLTYAL